MGLFVRLLMNSITYRLKNSVAYTLKNSPPHIANDTLSTTDELETWYLPYAKFSLNRSSCKPAPSDKPAP